jgi:hypothetical protein
MADPAIDVHLVNLTIKNTVRGQAEGLLITGAGTATRGTALTAPVALLLQLWGIRRMRASHAEETGDRRVTLVV